MLRKIVLVLAIVGLVSCSSIGPKEVHLDRAAYDDVVRQTDFQQLLTNIVRLRYLEPTSYLKVTSLTASYSLSNSFRASPSWSATRNTGGGNPSSLAVEGSLGLSPSISFTDSPTISYVPIDSADSVTILQTPVNFTDLGLLFSGGIEDMELYARLIFNRVGSLDNASSLTSPRVVRAIQYKQYYKFVDLFVGMLRTGAARIIPATFKNDVFLQLEFKQGMANSPDALSLKKILGVAPKATSIIFAAENMRVLKKGPSGDLIRSNNNTANNVVIIRTRSIYGIMAYLSHSVQIPESDTNIIQHIVDNNSKPISLDPLMQRLMVIYSSDSEPEHAFIKTYVHGHWFYIKESDIDSKATFSLMTRLVRLMGGLSSQSNQQLAPTLTLPVGA